MSIRFMFVLFLFPLLVLGQDKLEWSDTTELAVIDFQAVAPNTGTLQTVQGHIVIEYQFANYELMASRNFNKNVGCYFYRKASWLDSGALVPQLLRYANTQFDLNEWLARELRKRFRENRSLLLKGQQGIIYDQVTNEFATIQSDYSKETDHGRIESMQALWEKKIEDALTHLQDYCRTCKPSKAKKAKKP